jgi:hypothetical protein
MTRAQRRVALRGQPGAAVARAGALVLSVALRRQYQRSAVSVSMAAAVLLLGLAVLSFVYPMGVGLSLCVVCLWLGAGALLRAVAELIERRSPKRRRRRISRHGEA